MQTDDRRAAIVEHGDRVAIADADHSATELPGVDRADDPEGQEQNKPGADDPMYRRRDGRRPSCISIQRRRVWRETAIHTHRIRDIAQLRGGPGLARLEPGAA
jgi:hypothetical protein